MKLVVLALFVCCCTKIIVLCSSPKADGFTTIDFLFDKSQVIKKVDAIDEKTSYRLKKLNDMSNLQCSPLRERTFEPDSDFDLAICIARNVSAKDIIYQMQNYMILLPK